MICSVTQDFIWKFSQVVPDFKNNQKLSKGSKIIFILKNVTAKAIYKLFLYLKRRKFSFQIQHKQRYDK